jgi:hypothetical protein
LLFLKGGVGGGLKGASMKGGTKPRGYGMKQTVSKRIGGGTHGDGVGKMMGIRGKEAGDKLDFLQMVDSTGHDCLAVIDVHGPTSLQDEQMVC